jgi:hypothetical protein
VIGQSGYLAIGGDTTPGYGMGDLPYFCPEILFFTRFQYLISSFRIIFAAVSCFQDIHPDI